MIFYAKGTKGTKGTKGAKGAKGAKGMKGMKGMKATEAMKGRAFSDGLRSKIRFRHVVILITMLKP